MEQTFRDDPSKDDKGMSHRVKAFSILGRLNWLEINDGIKLIQKLQCTKLKEK